MTLTLTRIIRSLLDEKGCVWVHKNGRAVIAGYIEGALAAGDEFYSVEDFKPLLTVNEVAHEFSREGAVFVEEHE